MTYLTSLSLTVIVIGTMIAGLTIVELIKLLVYKLVAKWNSYYLRKRLS